MGRWRKALDGMRNGPGNVRFAQLEGLVRHVGYVLRRQSGSHRIYTHATRQGLPMINLQEDAGKAKAYQVRQVIDVIDTHELEVD